MFRVLTLILFLVSSVCTFSQILDYQNISESSISSSNSKMIFDNNYNLHFTWLDSTNQLFYRYREGNAWSERILVYETDSTEITELAISSYNDSIRIFWIEKDNDYKIKSITLPDTTISLLCESAIRLQNLKSQNNSTNNFLFWFEGDPNFNIKAMNLNSGDTLTIGHAYSPYSFSISKDNKDSIYTFWLGSNNLFFKTFDTTWSDRQDIILEGEAQPLLEMDCTFNEINEKFCFVFTGDIPTTGSEYSTGLFYLEGNDTTWSAITSLEPPIQYCTNPQIEIYEWKYSIILYQDGYGRVSYSDSKFYYTQNYYDYFFSDTLFAPDSSILNDFTSDGGRLYCSFAKNNDIFFGDIDIITPDVKRNNKYDNYTFTLEQNYPNPFNPSTIIKYQIPSSQQVETPRNDNVNVSLKIYDILGKEVATLVNEQQQPGNYQVHFDAASGSKNISSGIYFYRLKYSNFTQSRKMIILK